MKTCKKCNAILEDDAKFCNNCGAKVDESSQCPKCGKQVSTEFEFCLYCGAPVKTPKPAKVQKDPAKGKLRRRIILIAVIVAVIGIGCLTAFTFLSSQKYKEAFIYMKDGELNYTSLKFIKPVEITRKFTSDDINNIYYNSRLNSDIKFSGNGKTVFYPEKIATDGIDLYYRNLNKKDSNGEKIDTGVRIYMINKKGSLVFYTKGSDLYVNDLSDKDKIDSDVQFFYINEDGSKLLYYDTEGNIYYKKGKEDEDKIDSDSEIIYVSDNLDKMYYRKDENLYLWQEGEDKERILSGISEVLKIYDTGEIYYIKTEETEKKLADFINDDRYATDATLQEPYEPVYPYYEDCRPDIAEPAEPDYVNYNDYWGYIDWDAYYADYDAYSVEIQNYNTLWDSLYQEALSEYDQAYNVYEDTYAEYSAKVFRDDLRANLESETIILTNSILYYYDKKDSTAITDSYSSYLDYSSDQPVLIYENFNQSELSKMNISEVVFFDDVRSYAQAAMASSTEVYIAAGANTSTMKHNQGSAFNVNKSGDTIYFYDDYEEEEGYADLYEAKLNGTSFDEPVLYEEEVGYFSFLKDSDILYYFKEVTDYMGDLYINKERIDYDVYTNYIWASGTPGSMLYYTDYDLDNWEGTLMLYNGKDAIEIADDVYDCYAVNDKCVVYLQDYAMDEMIGDAYLYDGSKKRKEIDDNVSVILPIEN